jgi:hypothetical protein
VVRSTKEPRPSSPVSFNELSCRAVTACPEGALRGVVDTQPSGLRSNYRQPASNPVFEIVGIIGNTHNAGLDHLPDPVMIVPVAQVPDPYAAAYNDFQPIIW